jgi:hypothetical protein
LIGGLGHHMPDAVMSEQQSPKLLLHKVG